MPQMKHVQIAVTHGEPRTCVGAIACARAKTHARPGFQLYGYRDLKYFGIIFFRCDDYIRKALGVCEVTLCFAETGIGKDLAWRISQITAQETVRIVGRPQDLRVAEIILFTRFQDQFDCSGCGRLCNADFVP